MFTTPKNTRLKISENRIWDDNASKTPKVDNYILIYTLKTYQTMIGIGGAITDASSEVLQNYQ